MNQENKLKCDECGKDLGLDPYAYNKPEGEPARENELVCINEKCSKGIKDCI